MKIGNNTDRDLNFNARGILIIIICLPTILFSEAMIIRLSQAEFKQNKGINSFINEITYSDDQFIDLYIDSQNLSFFQDFTYTVISTESQSARNLANYMSYNEVIDILQDYAVIYPNLVSLYQIGETSGFQYYQAGNDNYSDYQHKVYALKLSDNPQVDEDEINIFYAGGIHAREPISVEVTMHILQHFMENYGIDAEITDLVENSQIWFIPLINPDGHSLVYHQQNIMMRKNICDNNENGQLDASGTTASTPDGVDLNRNFGYVWGPNGTSSNHNSSLYNGIEPWSEPEIIGLRELIANRKFFGGITYHSYAEKVLYPLGHIPSANSYDKFIMADFATEMAATIPRIAVGGSYQAIQAVDFGYSCQGTMGDWGYAEERIFSFTIELANQFIPPQVEQICSDNLEAAMIFIRRTTFAALTGNVVNVYGEPLAAELFVDTVDDQENMSVVEPYRASENFGRYFRPLLPGTYSVTFSLPGYLPQSFENIEISSSDLTCLEVVLKKEYVENVEIEIVENEVILSFAEEDGYDYEVYQSEEPDRHFQIVDNGNWQNSYTWNNSIDEEKMFYKIRRIISE